LTFYEQDVEIFFKEDEEQTEESFDPTNPFIDL